MLMGSIPLLPVLGIIINGNSLLYMSGDPNIYYLEILLYMFYHISGVILKHITPDLLICFTRLVINHFGPVIVAPVPLMIHFRACINLTHCHNK